MTAGGSDDERMRQKRQRSRSLAIALALGAMALLFYVATIVRLGPNAIRQSEFRPQAPAVEQGAPSADADACKKAGTC